MGRVEYFTDTVEHIAESGWRPDFSQSEKKPMECAQLRSVETGPKSSKLKNITEYRLKSISDGLLRIVGLNRNSRNLPISGKDLLPLREDEIGEAGEMVNSRPAVIMPVITPRTCYQDNS